MSRGAFGSDFNVYCDLVTDGGGWIVIQRNKKDSLVSFNRNWADYEKGFGDLNTEFWYGLEEIHCLTQRGQWEMRVDYQFTNNKSFSYLHYNQFSVGSASEEYPLTFGRFTGLGTDWLGIHQLNGRKFSTPDNDNEASNCAVYGGWWYNKCTGNNILSINFARPFVYSLHHSYYYYLLFTEMKIRPKDCIIQ